MLSSLMRQQDIQTIKEMVVYIRYLIFTAIISQTRLFMVTAQCVLYINHAKTYQDNNMPSLQYCHKQQNKCIK